MFQSRVKFKIKDSNRRTNEERPSVKELKLIKDLRETVKKDAEEAKKLKLDEHVKTKKKSKMEDRYNSVLDTIKELKSSQNTVKAVKDLSDSEVK